MLIQVYVHTWKYCSQNTTTLETRSHVQYDTIRKDHVRWQIRHGDELAGAAQRVQIATKTHCGGRAVASEPGGTKAEPAAARRRLGAARKDPTAGKRFGVRPLAAEHQPLKASRNTSQVFGFSNSMCLASWRLPRDSGIEVGSAAVHAGESTCQEL